MAQDLTVNIKTTSDVPQAMDKAKSATVSFGKQVDDITRKFSTGFKDIFLSFLGPMALVGIVLNYISNKIAENQQKHADANKAAIDGTNELMSAEDKYWARKRDREKKAQEDKKEATMSREDITKDFILNDPLGRAYLLKKMYGESRKFNGPGYLKPFQKGHEESAADLLSKSSEAQMYAQLALKEKMRDNPEAVKSENFKGPEGFGNVIGVGANPVMEAMAEQTELARQQLVELQKLNANSGNAGVPTDFTKDTK